MRPGGFHIWIHSSTGTTQAYSFRLKSGRSRDKRCPSSTHTLSHPGFPLHCRRPPSQHGRCTSAPRVFGHTAKATRLREGVVFRSNFLLHQMETLWACDCLKHSSYWFLAPGIPFRLSTKIAIGIVPCKACGQKNGPKTIYIQIRRVRVNKPEPESDWTLKIPAPVAARKQPGTALFYDCQLWLPARDQQCWSKQKAPCAVATTSRTIPRMFYTASQIQSNG